MADYFSWGTKPVKYGAELGPEWASGYAEARRNFLFQAADIAEQSRRKRAMLREQLRRLAQDYPLTRRRFEGQAAAAGMASSGPFFVGLGELEKQYARQRADIETEMADTEAQSLYNILRARYGLSDQGARLILNTFGIRSGEFMEQFR